MKTFKLLLVAIVATVTFASCSKDDDEPTYSLVDSTWVKTETNLTMTIDFFNSTECSVVIKSGLISIGPTLYTYTYSHPTVTMTPEDEGMAILKGEVSGDYMSVVNTSTNKDIGTYKKQ